MNNKGDDDQQFTIEKVRSTYTDITVKDCSPVSKPSVPITTSASVTATAVPPSSNKALNHPLSIVTCSGNQKIETTHSELKQVVENRLPPYTNVNVGHNQGRSNKPPKNTLKTPPKVYEKPFATVISESAILTPVATNNKVVGKANVSLNLLPRTEKLNQISITQNKQGEKTVSGNAVAEDRNSNSPIHKNIQDQITQLQSNVSCEAIEKNIQTKVLTVTPCTAAQKTATSPVAISVCAKETKTPGISKTPPPAPSVSLVKNNASPKEQFKPFQKSPACTRANEGNAKNGPPKVISTNNLTKPTIITTTELAKTKLIRSRGPPVTSTDTVWTMPVVKNDNEVSKVTPIKPILPAVSRGPPKVLTTVSRTPTSQTPPPQQISQGSQVTTGTVQTVPVQAVPVQTVSVTALPTSIANNRCLRVSGLQLSSLTSIDSHQELLDALNAGSNVPVTENLTISKQIPIQVPVIGPLVLHTVPETKIRNVSSETTIQSIPNKQPSNPTAETPLKFLNVTEAGLGRSGSMSQSPPPEFNTSSSPSSSDTGMLKHDVSTTVLSTSDESDPRRKQDEPECLTISSDEEPDEIDHIMSSSLSDNSDVTVSIMNKEPLIEKGEISGNRLPTADGSVCEPEEESALDVTTGDDYIDLICRTVRIGSYKVTPQCPVILSKYGLRIVIPSADDSENIVLKIPIQEIIKVLIHFGKSLPVIFYYVSPQIGAKVRMALNMAEGGDIYFDPTSDDESQKRITLLPEKFSDVDRVAIKGLYSKQELLADLNHREANALLMRSATREVRRRVQRAMKQVPPNPVQTIMVFPPPPAKGGISINTEDYSCLAEDVFLNDVIIDFYLKYLYLHDLSEEDRQKTHIFSSFFYKRLTDKATPVPRHLQNSKSGDGAISAAEIRHSRVKNWTKNIDLFSKDYIVIPLNENQHWFLAIICFPGLTGPVRFSDDSPINIESKETKSEAIADSVSASDSGSQTITIGSTTITPLRNEAPTSTNAYSVVDEDNDMEDRDEADGTDEDVNINSTSGEDTEDEYLVDPESSEPPIPTKCKPEREPIKQPCILIFDSLAGASRARIIATLREYLRVEYKVKHGEDRDFSKNVVRGAVPKVPQQDNFTDCGLYVLQYVETFFKKKIEDYHLPIKALRHWFSPELVSRKRYEIQQLLHRLMEEQNIDTENLHLPNLHLSSEPSDESDYAGFYEEDEDDEFYDGYECGEMEDMDGSPGQQHYPHVYTEDEDEDEYLEEVEMRRRYHIYDEEDEDIAGHDLEAESDEDASDDELYKDLDSKDAMKTKKCRRTLQRRMAQMESGEEQLVEEEDPEEHQFIAEVEERIGSSGLNRETVSICRLTSAVSRAPPLTCESRTPTSTTAGSTLAELKAARPFAQLDTSADGCSSKKKFKPN